MKEALTIIVLCLAITFGYFNGWASSVWIRWVAIPIVGYVVGATVRLIWL